MNRKITAGLYALLIVLASFSMVYYIAGALALREEFFHASRYARGPFDFRDDGQTLRDLQQEATAAGLSDGDFLLAVNGVPFTGIAQIHNVLRHTNPGEIIRVSARTPSGGVREVQIRLAPSEGPNLSLGGYIAFLTPILGVPLLGLLIGYWVVAARPRDLNAWLVLVLLAFPETAFGNLDWSFWPEPWYLLFGLWRSLVQILVLPALLWFGFLFPERWRVDLRLPWLKYVILAASFGAVISETGFFLAQHFSVQTTQAHTRLHFWTGRITAWLYLICILLFLAALFDKLRSASTADARRRLRVLAIGSGLSLGPLLIIFTVVPLLGMDPRSGKWFNDSHPISVALSAHPCLCCNRATGHGYPHPASHGHEISACPRHGTDG